jgi:nucleoside-diphosphate-sugar epimerase
MPYETVYDQAFEETRRRVPDIVRAQEALGFVAQTSLEDGLGMTLDWFRAQEKSD